MSKSLLKFASLSLLLYLAVTVAGAEQAKDVLHGDKFHNQKSADEFIRNGDLETSRQSYKDALKSYSEAITLDPRSAKAYAGRGNCFSRLQDDKRAIIDFDQALKLVPDDAVTLGLRGECKAYSHDKPDYHGAVEDYTKSIAIERDLPWGFAGRAEARIALHDYSGAIEDCNVILQKLPNDNRFLFNRAKAENGQGNYQAAWRDLSGLLKADLVKPDGLFIPLLVLISIPLSLISLACLGLVLKANKS